MASGSGNDPDDNIQEPVHGRAQREVSSAATSAGATGAFTASPPPVLHILRQRQRQRLPLQIHGQPGDGRSGPSRIHVQPGDGRSGSSQIHGQPGDGRSAPSRIHVQPGDRRSGPLLIHGQPGDGRSAPLGWSYATAEVDRKGKKVAAILSPIPSSPSSKGSSPRNLILVDSGAGTSSSPAGRGLQLQQVKSTQVKKSLGSKLNYSKIMIFGRKVRQMFNWNARGSLSPELSKRPHVDHQLIPWDDAFKHYIEDLKTSMREGVMPMNVVELHYSKFRPVAGDGECFYRSFIFSYLEQVLDMHDTHEESRLLAAVERVAIQYAHLGWTFEFSRSHKAFKRLINSVMRWKRLGSGVSTDSKKKLLDFFSTYDTTEDIFVFLRLVAAIWICLHREEFEPVIAGLTEDYSLKDWCFEHVTPCRALADNVQMRGLASALKIPLKVELLRVGDGQDIYTGPDVPPVAVTLLFTGNHYDIIYR